MDIAANPQKEETIEEGDVKEVKPAKKVTTTVRRTIPQKHPGRVAAEKRFADSRVSHLQLLLMMLPMLSPKAFQR